MTEKRTTPEPSAGNRRRKRAAPTIDLKATEVRPIPAASHSSPQAPPVQESQAQEHLEQENAKHESAEHVRFAAEPSPAAHDTASAAGANESGLNSRNGSRFGLTAPVLTAGVAGAAIMSLVLFALWLTGLVPIRDEGSADTRAQVTALQTQLQDLQRRPAPATNTQMVDALTQRVVKMEDMIAKIPAGGPAADPALGERVTAADNAMKSLGVALTALNRRNDDIATGVTQARARADAAEKAVANLRASLQDVSKTASAGASSAELEPLQRRIAALEQSAKTVREQLSKTSLSDTAARLALSAVALREAVLRGAPFAGELAQAKLFGAEEKALAALTPLAAGGVPNEKTLAQELSALLPGMLKASGAPAPSGSFIERLQANAGQLVKIRPLDAPADDNASAVLARIEIAAARGDIAAALADLGKLSDAQRAPAQGWIAKAQNRQAALAAARQFAADAARSLGSR